MFDKKLKGVEAEICKLHQTTMPFWLTILTTGCDDGVCFIAVNLPPVAEAEHPCWTRTACGGEIHFLHLLRADKL
jgi:hypothetical protein